MLVAQNISFDISYSPSVVTFIKDKPAGISGFYSSKGGIVNIYAQAVDKLKMGMGFGIHVFEADAKGIDNLFLKDIKYHFWLNRIEVPFHAKYTFFQHAKLLSYARASLGFVSHRLSRRLINAKLLDGTTLEGNEGMNLPLNYFMQIGIGQQWWINPSFVLTIEPYWSILKDKFEIIKEHPIKYHQFGVKLGIGFESFR